MNNLSPGGVFSEFPEEFHNKLVALVKKGELIQAIRVLRMETGEGLRECKEAVYKIRDEL